MLQCANAGGRTRGANEKCFVFVHQHGGYDVTLKPHKIYLAISSVCPFDEKEDKVIGNHTCYAWCFGCSFPSPPCSFCLGLKWSMTSSCRNSSYNIFGCILYRKRRKTPKLCRWTPTKDSCCEHLVLFAKITFTIRLKTRDMQFSAPLASNLLWIWRISLWTLPLTFLAPSIKSTIKKVWISEFASRFLAAVLCRGGICELQISKFWGCAFPQTVLHARAHGLSHH